MIQSIASPSRSKQTHHHIRCPEWCRLSAHLAILTPRSPILGRKMLSFGKPIFSPSAMLSVADEVFLKMLPRKTSDPRCLVRRRMSS